jgi:GNAT superfamily N-acetyltransferase
LIEVIMSHFKIRAATEADVPLLLALIRELAEYEKLTHRVVATQSSLRKWFFGKRPVAEAVLGCLRGDAVAYAAFYPTFSTFSGKPGVYLEDLFVRRGYRGRGYGQAMLRHVARLAKMKRFTTISWSVLHWNKPAIGFYRHLGAKPAPRDWLVYTLDTNALTRPAKEPDHRLDTLPRRCNSRISVLR